MIYFRLAVIGGAAIFALFSWIAMKEDGGAALNQIIPALGNGLAGGSADTVVDMSCMPSSIGNMYFRISTPKNFCSCLNSGKKDEEEILASGSTLEDFKSMCVDISYGKYSERVCREINSVLARNGKKSSVDCGCLFTSIKSVVSSVASFEGKKVMHESSLVSNYDKVVGLKRNDNDDYFEVPRSVVERCTK